MAESGKAPEITKRQDNMLKKLVRRYFVDGVGRSCAALAYYLIFSFFPLLIFLSVLIGFMNLPPLSADSLKNIIPADIVSIINSYLAHVSSIKSSQLLIFGLIFTIYFVSRAVDCLVRAIHTAYRVKQVRVFPKHQIMVLLYTLSLMIVVTVALALLTVGRSVLTYLSRFVPIAENFIAIWNFVRFFILAVMLFFALAILYCAVPQRHYKLRQVLPGTLAALTAWLVFSIGFAYYVENMANYSVIYGSIGAIIVLLLWLYFSAFTLIMGAEINQLIHEKKEKQAPLPTSEKTLSVPIKK